MQHLKEPTLLQIRLHGRGGQGVVTAAEMLSLAAFLEGHCAQAFPSFGSERTGAPVVAYAIINTKEAPEEIVPELVKRLPVGHVITVPATDFAMQKIGRPLPGAPMIAALAAVTGIFKLESV